MSSIRLTLYAYTVCYRHYKTFVAGARPKDADGQETRLTDEASISSE